MRCVVLSALLAFSAVASGQGADAAKQVYSASQDSIFLIYLNDSNGSPNAFGSAFLVAPRILITNAHVADAGNPVLAVGPIRIPLKVIRTDEKNDLAVLSVDANLTSKPIPLASGSVTPGEQVFAIGNPEGLEKTISQGIVSGIRNQNGRDLLQVTTPISHGSSGGPILNEKGEVVGVAVGMLDGGQNLNFAVPVALVREILAEKESPNPAVKAVLEFSDLKELIAARDKEEYSSDDSSKYQQDSKKIVTFAEEVEAATTSEAILNQLGCMGVSDYSLNDTGVKAARKLVLKSPSAEHHALLSYVLLERGTYESFVAEMAEKNSDAQTKAIEAKKDFMSEASREAVDVSKMAKGKTLLLADYVLATAKHDQGEDADAIALQTVVANGGLQFCESDLAEQAIRSLVRENTDLKNINEAEKWFGRLSGQYEVYTGEWDSEGDRRSANKEYEAAANAYEKAAGKGGKYYAYDWCFAANNREYQPVNDPDAVLADGRKCADAALKSDDKDNNQYFNQALPVVYRNMASILNSRGVYQSALEYIKESLSREPDSPFALIIEAEILENLQRYSECVTVAQSAIRASDGKYPWFQFDLGGCYFDMEDWPHAEAAYRIAAEGDKTNAGAAYNLGLTLLKEGYGGDARNWFTEALSRKPDEETRAKILNALK